MKRFLFTLIIFFFINNSFAGSNKEDKWKGKITYKNGIRVVENPVLPIFGYLKLDLKEDLKISSEEEKNHILYGEKLEIDEKGNIYFLDMENCTVVIFDKFGKYLKTIGRKGQGPGELQTPRDFYIDESGRLIVVDERKIHIFNKEGEFQNTISIPFSPLNAFISKNGKILVNSFLSSEEGRKNAIVVIDSNNQVVKTQYEFFIAKIPFREQNGRKLFFHLSHPYTPELYLTRLVDGKFLFGFSLDYTLYVLNQNLRIESQIKKDEPLHSIKTIEKDKIYEEYAYLEKKWGKDVLKEALQFPPHRPFYKGIITDEKGWIYIVKVASILEEKDRFIDVFDEKGRYIYQTSLPFTPEIIKKGMVYNIEINDETSVLELKRFKILNWDRLKKIYP